MFSNVISGSGDLATVGTGTLTLSGVNTYTGATSIGTGAALSLVGNGSISASSVVTTNGVFDISQTVGGASIVSLNGGGKVNLGANTLTLTYAQDGFNGTIQGTGGLAIAAGIEVLTGTNTYTGDTIIGSSGVLALAGTTSLNSAVKADGDLYLALQTQGSSIKTLSGSGIVELGDQTLTLSKASSTFSGSISGAGGVAVAGGAEVFNGVNTYTGVTTVTSAALEIGDAAHSAASLAGDVFVGSGGTLSGHGTVFGAVKNISGGTVSPGGSIGVLTVGSYTQGSNSALGIELNPNASSGLKSLGPVALAGRLALTFDEGAYSSRIYEILAGAPVTGAFSTVSSVGVPLGFAYGLFYRPNHNEVDVVMEETSTTEIYGAATSVTLSRAQDMASLVENRFKDILCARRSLDLSKSANCRGDGLWMQALNSRIQSNTTIEGFSYSNVSSGLLGGFDHYWRNGITTGVAFGYEHDRTHMAAATSNASGMSYFGDVYVRWATARVLVDAQAFLMHTDWSVGRSVAGFGSAFSKPSGDTGGALVQVMLPIRNSDFSPYARFTYARFDQPNTVETGLGALDFRVMARSTASAVAEAGVFISHRYRALNWGYAQPSFRIGVQDELAARSRAVEVNLNDSVGQAISQSSAKSPNMMGVVNFSMKLQCGQYVELNGALLGRFSENFTDASANIGGVVRF